MLLCARLIDLLTDPVVGLVNDRLRNQARPQWLISAGAIVVLAGVWWLFQAPDDANAVYLFLSLTLTYLGWTLLAIPYYALGAEIADDMDSRHQLAPDAAISKAMHTPESPLGAGLASSSAPSPHSQSPPCSATERHSKRAQLSCCG